MPRGIPANKVRTIEVEPPHNGSHPRGGLRGRLDRLGAAALFDARAIARTLEIIEEDDRRQAAESFPQKLLMAVGQRGGQRTLGLTAGEEEEEIKPRTKKKRRHSKHKEIVVRSGIFGQAMSLFILENMDDGEYRPKSYIDERLTETGFPPRDPRTTAGTLGALQRRGHIKKTADGYRRLAKGRDFAASQRQRLEEKGLVTPGGYTHAPS